MSNCRVQYCDPNSLNLETTFTLKPNDETFHDAMLRTFGPRDQRDQSFTDLDTVTESPDPRSQIINNQIIQNNQTIQNK